MACTNVFHTTKHNVKYYRIFAKQLFWCYNVDISLPLFRIFHQKWDTCHIARNFVSTVSCVCVCIYVILLFVESEAHYLLIHACYSAKHGTQWDQQTKQMGSANLHVKGTV